METIEYKGHRIEIQQDEYADSPRVWDNLSTFAFQLSGYELPNDIDIDYDDFVDLHYNHRIVTSAIEEAEKYIRKNFDVLEIFRVSAYIHGGISLSIGSPTCQWDSGYIGFMFIEKDKVRENFRIKRITKEFKEKSIEIAKSELETYSQYLNGEVYGYNTYDKDGEDIDSCWGYYGYDHEESGLLDMAKDNIDYHIKKQTESKYERIKTFIKNNVPLNVRMQYLTQ